MMRINATLLGMCLLELGFAGVAAAESTSGGLRWHSHDARFSKELPIATIASESGAVSADLIPYFSSNEFGVKFGAQLRHYRSADEWAKIEGGWMPGPLGEDRVPFIGKNAVARGEDPVERAGNVPLPEGVFDLRMHPARYDNLSVAAFIAPTKGRYVIRGMAARRGRTDGESVAVWVFDKDERRVFEKIVGNSGTWVVSEEDIPMGDLDAGDPIYFAVHRHTTWAFDQTVLAWTVECEPCSSPADADRQPLMINTKDRPGLPETAIDSTQLAVTILDAHSIEIRPKTSLSKVVVLNAAHQVHATFEPAGVGKVALRNLLPGIYFVKVSP